MRTASILNRGLRIALRGYAAAEPQMAFTLGMMVARLAVGTLAPLVVLGGMMIGGRSPAPTAQR